MRHSRSNAFATLLLAAATAPAQAIDFTFLTHESLVGVLSVDGFLGNGDDLFGTGLNTIGAASQFSASNFTYGVLAGSMTTAGVTPFGLVEQQFFGVSTHTSITNFGEWNQNFLGMFNVPFTQSLDAGSTSTITLNRDQSYTTDFVIDDPTYGGRLHIQGTGHYLLPFQNAADRYEGDLLTHFDTVVPLLPEDWQGVAQESQFWEVLDGPQAGVTGFTSVTFYSQQTSAVPRESTPVALGAPWTTTGWASDSADFPGSIQIGSPYEPAQDGTATLAGGASTAVLGVSLGSLGTGAVTVTGAGSVLQSPTIIAGGAGAELQVTAGGEVHASIVLRLGDGPLDVSVAGAGSRLLLADGSAFGFVGIADLGAYPTVQPSAISVLEGAEISVTGAGNASAVVYSYRPPLDVTVDGAGSALRIHGTQDGTAPSVITGLFLQQASTLAVTNGGVVEVIAANTGLSGVGLGSLLPPDPAVQPSRLVVDGAGSRVVAGPLFSAGVLFEFDPATSVYHEVTAPGGTSVVTVRNGGVLEADRIVIGANGTLNGSGGTLIGNVENHGVVAVGESPGVMVIDGDYTQGADGRLVIEIGGTTPGVDFDLLTVNGTMTLGGTLEIVLLNGFVPDADDSFGFLAASNIVGAFANILLPTLGNGQPLALHFGPTGITAGAAPVPVPGALWLFGGAVFALATRRRV
ncbi:MAG: hypothetical protein K2Y51_19310 [Gammaproteobacteria bacterium]|nr:hypothetical protein [Gammaproteobacteria bacterium]